jgi:hypothetical protein
MVGKEKKRRGPLYSFLFFLLLLRFLIKIDKIAVLHGNGQKISAVWEDTVDIRLKGAPCFLLAGGFLVRFLIIMRKRKTY